MTTYTIQGYSRVIDYENATYTDYSPATLEVLRQDPDDTFVFQYGWIDETGLSPKFAYLPDPWSHTAMLTRNNFPAIDLQDNSIFTETQVFQVEWQPGKIAYVLGAFQPMQGVETIFFIGGDIPVINDLVSLTNFMALPQDYILEGPYEAGNALSLSGFAGVTIGQDDIVTAIPDVALYWNSGAGNDVLTGGATDDTLLGGTGNDLLNSGGGSDTLWGGAGDDTLIGTGNFTNMSGGAGNDVLIGGSSFGENQDGGGGNDLITMTNGQDFGGGVWFSHAHANGGSGADTIIGGLAGDNAFGGNGADLMHGNEGDDWFSGGNGNDTMTGDAGNDQYSGGQGNDSLTGGTGNDMLDGGLNDDILYGDDGNDIIVGGDGIDYAYGGNNNDSLVGDAGNDRLFGDAGADTLRGGLGMDQLTGGISNDLLDGGDGKDLLKGEAGVDTLLGGAGNDTLWGGSFADVMDGGTSADQFRYTTDADSRTTAMDTILGFQLGIDDIDLSRIDANADLGGVQDFAFIGTGAFTAAGQVRLNETGGNTVVEVNITGTDGAEMGIVVDGITGLLATDFIL